MGSPALNLLSIFAVCASLMVAHSAGQFYTNGRYGGKRHILETERHGSQLLDFQLGSRYGRSDPEAASGPVSLITDNPKPEPERRFHANGRYGKRAPLIGSLAPFLLPLNSDRPQEDEIIGIDGSLLCRFSGLTNLYRCILRKDSSTEDSSSTSYGQENSSVPATGTPVN